MKIPPEQQQLNEILTKVLVYQHSLRKDRAVELDELLREGVLSPADAEFLSSNSVTYKPHRRSDFHALDMFHMPTDGGGCVFIGPSGPPLTKRHATLSDFQPVVESFLRLPRPEDELLLHIEFTEEDGMAVAPGRILFTLCSADWRQQLPAIRKVAGEFGLCPFHDAEVQCHWSLTFNATQDAAHTAAAVVALLNRGCAFSDKSMITYSAGALDEA